MNAHEELAHLGELADERRILGNELLDRFVVAKIPKVAEDGHETLGLEWETIHVQFCDLRSVCGSLDDVFVDDLFGEEVDDNIE